MEINFKWLTRYLKWETYNTTSKRKIQSWSHRILQNVTLYFDQKSCFSLLQTHQTFWRETFWSCCRRERDVWFAAPYQVRRLCPNIVSEHIMQLRSSFGTPTCIHWPPVQFKWDGYHCWTQQIMCDKKQQNVSEEVLVYKLQAVRVSIKKTSLHDNK